MHLLKYVFSFSHDNDTIDPHIYTVLFSTSSDVERWVFSLWLYSNAAHFVCHDLFHILYLFLIAAITDYHKLNICSLFKQ